MAISTSNLIGVSLTYTDTSPSFNVGTTVNLDDGGQAVYVQAASTVSTYMAVSVKGDNTVVPLTTTNSANSKVIGFAQASIASGSYGWVQIGGKPVVNLAASCLPAVPLFTTATAGTLDDVVVPDNAYTQLGREQVRAFYSQLSSIESTGAQTLACTGGTCEI